MLKRFRIQSFKVIGNLEITLDRFTVLVGPNACGKSSVLQAMSVLCDMKERWPKQIFTGRWVLSELVTRSARMPLLLRAEGESFALEWSRQAPWEEKESLSRLTYESSEGRSVYEDFWQQLSLLQKTSDGTGYRSLHKKPDIDALRVLPRAELFRFEFDNLAAPAAVKPKPRLVADGRGLAAVLGHLALEYPPIFQRIKHATLSVIPSIRDIRLRNTTIWEKRLHAIRPGSDQVEEVERAAHEILFDTKGGKGIPAHAMSDGTLRVLALLTAALGRNPPKLILLDDIERGVHPRAMIELVRLLQKALDEVPDLQIVATTHSPDLLDQLQPGQIRLLWLGDDGLTRCESMNEHPAFDTWRDIMTPGEMWSVMDRRGTDGDAS